MSNKFRLSSGGQINRTERILLNLTAKLFLDLREIL